MGRIANLVLLLIVFAGSCLAQPGGPRKFSPEEFRANLERFITKHAGFTSEESQAFYPLYHEMKDRQRDVQHTIFKLKEGLKPNASEEDYAKTIQNITSLNRKKSQIEETYYKKMCQAVPASKVYRAMLAEDKFHRQMLGKMPPYGKKRK